ncbi:hypothetical protein L596_018150 [Steinernema carpocapsae]|nr:hypothetical protein L596_018150 [Steinernema carpocapsae]
MMATGSPTRTGGFGGGFFDSAGLAPLSASQNSIPAASHAHHRRALASFAPSSTLSPADAAKPHDTYAASSPSSHGSKINKFIAFFSSHEPTQHKSLDLSTASERREVLKRAATTGTASTSSTGQEAPIQPVKQRDVQYQGQVFHKEVCLGESSKRTAARRWDQCFAVLHRHRLYLCKQLSSSQASDDDPLNKVLNIPGDAKVLEVKAAIVDIAYEVLQSEQRHNVVRIMTQQQQHVEHFLQTESETDMLTWIEKIRSATESTDARRKKAARRSRCSLRPTPWSPRQILPTRAPPCAAAVGCVHSAPLGYYYSPLSAGGWLSASVYGIIVSFNVCVHCGYDYCCCRRREEDTYGQMDCGARTVEKSFG